MLNRGRLDLRVRRVGGTRACSHDVNQSKTIFISSRRLTYPTSGVNSTTIIVHFVITIRHTRARVVTTHVVACATRVKYACGLPYVVSLFVTSVDAAVVDHVEETEDRCRGEQARAEDVRSEPLQKYLAETAHHTAETSARYSDCVLTTLLSPSHFPLML